MELKTWKNSDFVSECIKEIIDLHKTYEKFSIFNSKEAEKYLSENIKISA